MNMDLLLTVIGLFVSLVCGQETPKVGESDDIVDNVRASDDFAGAELVRAFAILRHGDRTPDPEEIELCPEIVPKDRDIFFPFGKKALTNKGKARAFKVGEYLRKRYDGFLSRLYLPEEISVRTTDYARTKMTALCALAALYPPSAAQKWNPNLNWQPVPYSTKSKEEDDLLYWYNCDRYTWLRDQIYTLPEMQKKLEPYTKLFKNISEHTKTNVTTAENVFFLDNLFQAVENVGVSIPEWAKDVMPEIKELTKIEYNVEFYNKELIRLAGGMLLNDILEAANATVNSAAGNYTLDQPKLSLYVAHENNVAALMAASRVFDPHQPKYASLFTLELRRKRDGSFGIAAIYFPVAGSPGSILPVKGCGGGSVCDFDEFLNLTQENVMDYDEFQAICPRKSH